MSTGIHEDFSFSDMMILYFSLCSSIESRKSHQSASWAGDLFISLSGVF